MIEHYLRETAGATANFQYVFILQVFFIPTGFSKKTVIALLHIFLVPVNLSTGKLVPLVAKILCVVIFLHKPVSAIF